ALSQRVVVRVAEAADRRLDPSLSEPLRVPNRRVPPYAGSALRYPSASRSPAREGRAQDRSPASWAILLAYPGFKDMKTSRVVHPSRRLVEGLGVALFTIICFDAIGNSRPRFLEPVSQFDIDLGSSRRVGGPNLVELLPDNQTLWTSPDFVDTYSERRVL